MDVCTCPSRCVIVPLSGICGGPGDEVLEPGGSMAISVHMFRFVDVGSLLLGRAIRFAERVDTRMHIGGV